MRLDGIHHASLSVTDLQRSREWYRELFDLEEVMFEDGEDRAAVVFRLPGTDAMLGLVQHRDNEAAAFLAATTGLDHLAFRVDTLDGIHEWAEHLTARGIGHSGVIEVPPGAICNLRDPDAIQLALFWAR